MKTSIKFLTTPFLNTTSDDVFSAVHMSPLTFSFLTIEYPVDCLNSHIHPFVTNDLLFGACLMIPSVIFTFMRSKLQHHYSHFITHFYEIMRKKCTASSKNCWNMNGCTSKGDDLARTRTLSCQAPPELRLSVC